MCEKYERKQWIEQSFQVGTAVFLKKERRMNE
jgi:hypothetical protein